MREGKDIMCMLGEEVVSLEEGKTVREERGEQRERRIMYELGKEGRKGG